MILAATFSPSAADKLSIKPQKSTAGGEPPLSSYFSFFFSLSSAFSVVCLWSYVRVCVRAYVLLRVYLQTRVCVCDRMYMRGRVCRVRLLVYRNVINLGAYSVLGYLYKLFYSSL